MFEALGARLRAYAEKDGRGYPDWALRYVPIVQRLQPRLDASVRILEIGANENGLARFIDAPVIAVDLSLSHLHAARAAQGVRAIAADVCALPFSAASVDVCVCMDTVEHVPARVRDALVDEIVRVLRPHGVAVVAFPAGADAARAEAGIRDAYYRATGGRLRWFEEHVDMGLPDPGGIVGRFRARLNDTHCIAIETSTPVWIWSWTWRILLCGWPGRGNALFQAWLRVVTPLLCRIQWGDCYRTAIWYLPRHDA